MSEVFLDDTDQSSTWVADPAPPINNFAGSSADYDDAGPISALPIYLGTPSVISDDGSVAVNAVNSANFYPPDPTPGATGKNVVNIAGDTYVVTPDNYTQIAQLYINYEAVYNGVIYNNQMTISLLQAMKHLAYPDSTDANDYISYTDSDTGAVPNTSAADAVLANPVIRTADAISGAATNVFNGAAQATQDTANFIGGLGGLFSTPGNFLIVVGGLIALYVYFKAKK